MEQSCHLNDLSGGTTHQFRKAWVQNAPRIGCMGGLVLGTQNHLNASLGTLRWGLSPIL